MTASDANQTKASLGFEIVYRLHHMVVQHWLGIVVCGYPSRFWGCSLTNTIISSTQEPLKDRCIFTLQVRPVRPVSQSMKNLPQLSGHYGCNKCCYMRRHWNLNGPLVLAWPFKSSAASSRFRHLLSHVHAHYIQPTYSYSLFLKVCLISSTLGYILTVSFNTQAPTGWVAAPWTRHRIQSTFQ